MFRALIHSPFAPVAAAATVLILSMAYWRMQRVVQALRIKMAVCGEALIASGELTPNARGVVDWMLGTAFRSRTFLFFALVATPVAAFVVLFGEEPKGISDGLGPEAKREANRLNQLHTAVMFANHPLVFVCVVFNAVIWLCIAAVAKLLYGGAFTRRDFGGLDIVGRLLETRPMRHSLPAIGT